MLRRLLLLVRGDAAGRELRCGWPYECYSDYDCWEGYSCSAGYCVPWYEPPPPPPPVALPRCPEVQADVSQWDLTQNPGGLGLGDLDGDGDLDVFAALPTAGAIELAFNDGTGVFTPGEVIDVGEPQTDLRVAGGDLDGPATSTWRWRGRTAAIWWCCSARRGSSSRDRCSRPARRRARSSRSTSTPTATAIW
ncbi:MAG TPA: FG-GAP-like repeat-containing protein [Nannocystis sp.]